jgi:hypothetical protein
MARQSTLQGDETSILTQIVLLGKADRVDNRAAMLPRAILDYMNDLLLETCKHYARCRKWHLK